MPVCLFALHYACLSVCLASCVSVCLPCSMRVCLSLIPSLSLPLPSLSYLRPLSLPFGVEGDATAHTHTHTHTHTQDFKAKNESMTKAERDELMAHRRALEQEVSCLIEPKRLTLVPEARPGGLLPHCAVACVKYVCPITMIHEHRVNTP